MSMTFRYLLIHSGIVLNYRFLNVTEMKKQQTRVFQWTRVSPAYAGHHIGVWQTDGQTGSRTERQATERWSICVRRLISFSGPRAVPLVRIGAVHSLFVGCYGNRQVNTHVWYKTTIRDQPFTFITSRVPLEQSSPSNLHFQTFLLRCMTYTVLVRSKTRTTWNMHTVHYTCAAVCVHKLQCKVNEFWSFKLFFS